MISRFIAIGVALGIALDFSCLAPVRAADEPPFHVLRRLLAEGRPAAEGAMPATHLMRLHLGVMSGSGWRAEAVLDAAQRAAGILGQCAIGVASIELHEFDGPQRYRSLFTPVSRELAQRSGLARPAVFFVADTRNRPAFDAEAVGRSNSRTRPEMADTVWIASGARDLPVLIAHELAHVLADTGEHSNEPGNLMREETVPGGTRLTAAQCATIVATAAANGLLQAVRP